MNNEIWKDIQGYKGEYQVSNWGRIKSLKRKVRSKNWITHHDFYRTVNERILKPGKYCKSGHLSVVFRHNGCGKPVHQLVMNAFVGKPPDGMEVLHINGNPQDNRLSNLRYGTRRENILDVYNNDGRWRKLTEKNVYAIRFYLLCGYSGSEIAKTFNVSQTTISSIKLGRTFEWLK